MTIICVDNHSIMLKRLLKIIQELVPNAFVGACSGADEAMEFAKEHGCDVLISEIEFAGINGLMLAKRMKKLNSKVNIIFLTVCDEREYAKEVMNIKPSGYLVKPAKIEQLAYELNNLRYAPCAILH